jgi:hypothetical protein
VSGRKANRGIGRDSTGQASAGARTLRRTTEFSIPVWTVVSFDPRFDENGNQELNFSRL